MYVVIMTRFQLNSYLLQLDCTGSIKSSRGAINLGNKSISRLLLLCSTVDDEWLEKGFIHIVVIVATNDDEADHCFGVIPSWAQRDKEFLTYSCATKQCIRRIQR